MTDALESSVQANSAGGTQKDKSCLLGVINRYLEACDADLEGPVLVIGGGQEDLEILSACGFNRIVVSNIDSSKLVLTLKTSPFPIIVIPLSLRTRSYTTVVAHIKLLERW